MACRTRWVLAVLLLLVLSVLPLSVMAQEDPANARTGFRPDAPPYGARGPQAVGTRALMIEGEPPLDITVWYPAIQAEGVEPSMMYPYVLKWEMLPNGMDVDTIEWSALPGGMVTVSGQAISEAPVDDSAGPYPVVILSPGLANGTTAYAWLGEHLASYGFVVIAPEHHEVADMALSALWKAAITRPQEIQMVLTYADTQASAGGWLDGLIDPELVAVVGHSYGGFTALMAAGARYDMGSFETLCAEARAAEDPNAWLCDLLQPFIGDMAELAGLDAVPEGLWPDWGAARVDAIVSMAGDAYLFGEAGLSEVTVPVLALGGTLDIGTPYLWGTYPTYEHVSSDTRVRVTFEGADHMIFNADCDAMPWFAEIGLFNFCSDPVWDMERAHDLTNHFTTAFLLAELKQDEAAAAALAPDAVFFPAITYEADGF